MAKWVRLSRIDRPNKTEDQLRGELWTRAFNAPKRPSGIAITKLDDVPDIDVKAIINPYESSRALVQPANSKQKPQKSNYSNAIPLFRPAVKPSNPELPPEPNKPKGATQIAREQVLADWLKNYQAKNPHINIQSLPFDKDYMFKLLAEKNELFHGLSLSSFNRFWNQQKLCKVSCGAKRRS